MKNAHVLCGAPRIVAGILLLAACQASTQTEVSPAPAATTADPHVHTPGMVMDTARATPAGARDTMAHQMDPDTRFMHHMTAHHAQALAMVRLVPSRTTSQGLRLLAERIDISQKDEIALMRRWLERHGRPLPDTGLHAMHMTMPGMLTEADMASLAAVTGAEFERVFLELMIRHHQGALVMVRQLLGSPGGGQDSEVYRLVADIEADQQGEIARMQAMLTALGARPPR